MKRRYGQSCPIAHALDLIGERWALLVVRELRLGARRFADLQAGLPDITPGVLAQRLRDLEQVGVLRRRTLPPPVAGRVYELTEWGTELEPVFTAMATWAVRSPLIPLEGDVSEDSVMLGIRTFFAAGDQAWDATYEIRLERETYAVAIEAGELAELARRHPSAPDATLATDRFTMLALLTQGASLPSAVEAGTATVAGDAGALERLLAAVPDLDRGRPPRGPLGRVPNEINAPA